MILLLVGIVFKDFIENRRKTDIFPILLLVNFFATALVISISRINLGPDQAMSSRYVIFSLTILLACVLYIFNNNGLALKNYKVLSKINYKIIATLLIFIVVISFAVGIHKSSTYHREMLYNKFYLMTYDTQPDAMLDKLLLNGSKFLRELAPILKEKSLSVFKDQNSLNQLDISIGGTELDNDKYLAINDIQLIHDTSDPYLYISGAALDPQGYKKLDSVYLILNAKSFKTIYGKFDPIVERLSKSKRYKYSGFFRAIPLKNLELGDNNLSVMIVSKDKSYIINSDINIVINENMLKIIKSFDM
ncbi:MAG: hypothetical protein LBD41_02970 [Clostridiales Family XIII bacterium]|nr:hypothetical protein [Clostridiales Family XIII bacterium]